MPVIGSRDADGVDRFVGQNLAEVGDLFGLMAAAAGDRGGALEVGLVYVADRGHRDSPLRHGR